MSDDREFDWSRVPPPLSHRDWCCLSLRFNRNADLGNPQHYRINEWLKKGIEDAKERDRSSN